VASDGPPALRPVGPSFDVAGVAFVAEGAAGAVAASGAAAVTGAAPVEGVEAADVPSAAALAAGAGMSIEATGADAAAGAGGVAGAVTFGGVGAAATAATAGAAAGAGFGATVGVACTIAGGGGALLKNQPAISAATTAATPSPAHRPVRFGAGGIGGAPKPTPVAGDGLGRARSTAIATDGSGTSGTDEASAPGTAGPICPDGGALRFALSETVLESAFRLNRVTPHFAQDRTPVVFSKPHSAQMRPVAVES